MLFAGPDDAQQAFAAALKRVDELLASGGCTAANLAELLHQLDVAAAQLGPTGVGGFADTLAANRLRVEIKRQQCLGAVLASRQRRRFAIGAASAVGVGIVAAVLLLRRS